MSTNWRARRDAAPPSGIFRVVYRYDAAGHGFAVQENRPGGSNEWWTVDGFKTLHHALLVYPEATASELALSRQDDLEQRSHEFSFDDDRSYRCDHCGQLSAWPEHIKRKVV